MSELNECHDYADGVWTCIKRDGDMVLFADFCPTCGVKLHADGTVTLRCDAVTSEAVRGTQLWDWLNVLRDEAPLEWEPLGECERIELRSLETLDLCVIMANNERDGVMVNESDQGRIILAVSDSSRAMAALEYIAKCFAAHLNHEASGTNLTAPTTEQLVCNALAAVGAAPLAPDHCGAELKDGGCERCKAEWDDLVAQAARAVVKRDWQLPDRPPMPNDDLSGYLDWTLWCMKLADDLTVKFSQEDIAKLRDWSEPIAAQSAATSGATEKGD